MPVDFRCLDRDGFRREMTFEDQDFHLRELDDGIERKLLGSWGCALGMAAGGEAVNCEGVRAVTLQY
jgi:hypothetical protein